MRLEDFTQRIKKTSFIKSTIKFGSMAFGVAAIVVATLFDIGPNEEFDLYKWLSDALIMMGIIIFGMSFGESSGKDITTHSVAGLYQRTINQYKDVRESIRSDGTDAYFQQYYAWRKEREYKEKMIETLDEAIADRQLCEMIVETITPEDIPFLGEKAYVKEGKRFRRFSERELEAIKKVMLKGIPYHTPKNSYYLTAHGRAVNIGMLESPYSINKDITANELSKRAIKIVSALTFSLLFALLTVRELAEDGQQKAALLKLIFRLCSLVSGFSSGFGTGIADTRLRAELLQNKYEVLSSFRTALSNKLFTPKTYDEIVEEEIKQDIIPQPTPDEPSTEVSQN